MQAATRLLAAFLLLIATFLVLVGFSVVSLVSAGQHGLAAVVATAGLAGVVAGAITYWLLRRDGEVLEIEAPTDPPPPHQPRTAPGPLRVQAMPVADLPPAYVDAVLKGAQARLSAMKAEAGKS